MSERTPDQAFARYVKLALVAFAVCFIYFVVADIRMPMTPQARVYHQVTQISPQLNGPIIKVLVSNNQHVEKGQVLFEIDDTPYNIALEKAQIKLANVAQENAQIDAQVDAMKARIAAATAILVERKSEYQRLNTLIESNVVSQQDVDKANAQLQSAEADLSALKAELNLQIVARGERGERNLKYREARNALNRAELNLAYTRIKAPHEGIMANMQVTKGTYAKQSVPLASVVDNKLDLVADFREKSLTSVEKGVRAKVVFDAIPGKVFAAQVEDLEAGVSDGQLSANGKLAAVEKSNRWVRDAQRQRVHISLDESEAPLNRLTSGARATVQIVPNSPIESFVANVQIRFISLLHYVY
ncbi:putative efflux pump protein [Alteromonas mediterranea MED64]|uniref:Hemolysin D n=1 Tax=Alteromonas mediterranea TaxID=314275 RepID=A0AAC9J8S2_9ALTE|nr:HlyD family secretion protein [Alteromonas mediterranea]AGP81063.1 putative efflux pump protein [Alteromonas mediterranea MED64]APD89244.1 hemolysin D [Alteromonas mediterranea]MBR9896696.1 HlyD family secretion protein [Gammaproteobacteria bacterium]MEA3380989.1 HlyD family secretion protein [Pseudomonadota bacterium]